MTPDFFKAIVMAIYETCLKQFHDFMKQRLVYQIIILLYYQANNTLVIDPSTSEAFTIYTLFTHQDKYVSVIVSFCSIIAGCTITVMVDNVLKSSFVSHASNSTNYEKGVL